ncbi:uncharacterized protein H6S33_013101 [Morchella sextelata]|uniref:uncharacterized protein n=1 Tax=Morchella sextelata TaxID=1174677 RepID=UPI001D04374C|nr:uncharacterized protein H6S33_013101 [Morchella sextelata]KAH0609615.1 hypothetical protein H6S33_013101 [Morchella sextelata]
MSMTAQELTFHMHTPQGNRAMDGKQAAKQHKQRQQTNRPAPYPSPSKRQGGGYQHRRHNSVADALTLGSATAQTPINSNASISAVRTMNGLGIKVNGDEQNHNHPTTADGSIDMEYWGIMNDQRPRTPTCQGILTFNPVTPQSPFTCYQQNNASIPHDIDQFLSGIDSPAMSRRVSVVSNHSPLRANFQFENSQVHDLPTPPHTARLGHNTFDMAPLPHIKFASMSAISNMGSEADFEGAPPYSPLSPAFDSIPSSPPVHFEKTFRSPLSIVVQKGPALAKRFQQVDLPALAPAPRTTLETPPPAPVRESSSTPSEKATEITIDLINSYISGPEATDGKWLCLYPDCEKRFGRKENIKSHVQTHLGDRQFLCETCKKCFVRHHDLKRHSKIHTGVKPYPCDCGNAFARHDALTRHRQRGMCSGAFEGVIRKVVKRGRPRKKPLKEEEDRTVKPEENTEGSEEEAYFASDASNPPSPRDIPDFSSPAGHSPGPQTPQYVIEGTPSLRESSPSASHDFSIPPSPHGGYDFEDFTSSSGRGSLAFNALDGSYDMPAHSIENSSMARKPQNSYTDELLAQPEYSMFTHEGVLDLTALERDPDILGFQDYIKPELLNNSQDTFFGSC